MHTTHTITPDTAIRLFVRRMRGKLLRGQQVEEAEIMIDTTADEQTRHMLTVYFREHRAPETDSDEQKMLKAVFNDTPYGACYMAKDYDDMMAVLLGDHMPEPSQWTLSDEK